MRKKNKKTKLPSPKTRATSPQQPPLITGGEAAGALPQVPPSSPTQPSTGADDNPWRRFLALGKGLPTDTGNAVASPPVLDIPKLDGTMSPRALVSPSSTEGATPAHRTPDFVASPLQLEGAFPAGSTGFTPQSPSSLQWDSLHPSGWSPGRTTQPATATSPLSSPSSPTEDGAAAACATSARDSEKTKTMPHLSLMWLSDGTWSVAVVVASVALLTMVLLYVAWELNRTRTVRKEQRFSMTVCSTGDCNLHATSLMDAIDRSVQPCDDFEGFACGRREHPPALRSFHTRLKRHWHVVDANLMLTRGRNQTLHFAASRKATAMLRACLWQGSLREQRLGRQALIEFMRERGLSWPEPAGPAPPSKGLQVLLDLSINWAVDIWFRLTFVRHHSGNKFYFREPTVFVTAIKELRQQDGPDGGRERVRSTLHQLRNASQGSRAIEHQEEDDALVDRLLTDEGDVLERLQEAMRSSPDEGNTLDKLPLKLMVSVTDALPGTTWQKVLRSVLNGTGVPVGDNDTVFIDNARLLSTLGDMVVSMRGRLLDQLALWFLQLHADLLPIPPRDWLDRTLACHAAVELRFGLVVSAEHMANQIKLWPSSQLSDAWLTRLYADFPDRAPSYVQFWLAAGKAQRSLQLAPARNASPANTTVNAGRFDRGTDVLWFSNAARDPPFEYDYWANRVLLSPAALYAPLFYARGTNAMVYAGLGATLAWLAAKAFDERGIDVSAGENLIVWLSGSARQQFVHRAKCRQPALKAAITGYNRTMLRTGGDVGLHVDRDYPPWQMFFLSFCQPLCGLPADIDGPRAPRGRLCNQVLMSTRDFSSAFKCRIGGHPMAPASICSD
ncbi:endothelin-converting enzyme 2-like isoform X2 [Dermacentor albipictus]|uniref:endothelin-converting enzyme 2-like isoform X2 n=1 Tax=Dermacentor albipictus TaxID=60249 RepID=UPI0031FD936C